MDSTQARFLGFVTDKPAKAPSRLSNALAHSKAVIDTGQHLTASPGTGYANSLNKFGIDADEYNRLLVLQGNGCAICGNKCKTNKRLAVDHCHATGKVRGLLCAGCNTALGQFNDDTDMLNKAIEYLLDSA